MRLALLAEVRLYILTELRRETDTCTMPPDNDLLNDSTLKRTDRWLRKLAVEQEVQSWLAGVREKGSAFLES